MIEVVNDNGMNRRTAVYQDLLYDMEFSANPHNYTRAQALQYRFGYIEGVGGQEIGDINIVRDYDKTLTPILINEDLEEEPIAEIMTNLLETDVLLVPVTQIRPEDERVTLDKFIKVEITEDEKRKRDLDLINSIDLSKYSPEKMKANDEENEKLKKMQADNERLKSMEEANKKYDRMRREEEEAMARAEE
jgi:hypothetical protein